MNIHITRYLDSKEVRRLDALAKAMSAVVKPNKPFTRKSLLSIYGWSGCADLFKTYCSDYGVPSWYSPEAEFEKDGYAKKEAA